MSYYEVRYYLPGSSSLVGERILAQSVSHAAAAVKARCPGIRIAAVIRLD